MFINEQKISPQPKGLTAASRSQVLVALAFIMSLILVLTACNSSETNDLESTSWELVSLAGEELLADTTITLEFSESEVSGTGGCNHYGGSYQVAGNSLTLRDLFWTEMGCPEPAGLLEQENNYLDLLSTVDRFELDGNVLALYSGQNGLLTFETGQSVSVAAAVQKPTAVPPTATAVPPTAVGATVVATEIPPTPIMAPPAGFQAYQDDQAGVMVYMPDSWVVASVTEGQYAIFQSYPLDKYVGGEMMEPNDSKCDLNIYEAGTEPEALVLLWESDPMTEIISQDEVVLNSGQTGQRFEIESMGRNVVLVATVNDRTVTLACFRNLEPFDQIALTLTGVE